jgi:hypothetical protein
MGRFARWLLIFLGLLAYARAARAAAWIETTVASDAVTVELQRDGRATVSHSIALKIRGGPLKSWTLQGIDRDAEPLPDASVVNSNATNSQNTRRNLELTKGDDESLLIDIDDDRGLKQGTYLLQFSYRTDFRTTKMIRSRGPWLEIGWIGPRFATGLDGAKVTFRLPAASTAPRLPELDVDPDLPNVEGAPVDSFVSTVRRNTSFDEIDLVRAHVAQGEPVLWRLWASPAAFDSSIMPTSSATIDHAAPTAVPIAANKLGGWTWIAIAFSAAILWISVLLCKLQLYSADCQAQGSKPRAVLRLHPVLRVTLSGFFVAAAVVLAWSWQSPTLATLCIAAAMLCAAQNAPLDARALRGPGVWLPLTDSEAFSRNAPPTRSRYLDASRWQGRLMLTLWLLAVAIVMFVMARRSSYDAALLGLLCPLPLVLFLTARSTQLPNARRSRSAQFLAQLHRQLTHAQGLKVIAWARFPEGEAAPDELRLRVIPPRTVPGFLGLEVVYCQIADTQESTVSLLLRAEDGTAAQQVWRGQLVWQRGRRADERVATYPLIWPSCALAEDVIVQMLRDLMSHDERDARKPGLPNKSSKSKGRSVMTSKDGVASLPSHSTRRA